MSNNITGERIKILTMSLNMTQKKLSQMSGVREASISHYISGRNSPNSSTIQKIASATHVSPTWLMGFGDENNIDFIN